MEIRTKPIIVRLVDRLYDFSLKYKEYEIEDLFDSMDIVLRSRGVVCTGRNGDLFTRLLKGE